MQVLLHLLVYFAECSQWLGPQTGLGDTVRFSCVGCKNLSYHYCLLVSALAGSWSQEPELGIELTSDVDVLYCWTQYPLHSTVLKILWFLI